jgi:hypothetical protein
MELVACMTYIVAWVCMVCLVGVGGLIVKDCVHENLLFGFLSCLMHARTHELDLRHTYS